jgi:DNA-binding NarL/FixJ family response regulator
MIHVLIADDHQIFLDGLRAVLQQEKDIKINAEALNGEQVLAALKFDPSIEILILDIEMPGMSGIEVVSRTRELYPEMKVLMLTSHNKPDLVDQLTSLQVNGYILKNKGIEQLVAAIRAIANGEHYFGQEVMATIIASKKKTGVGNNTRLTKREEEILRLIAREYTSPQIAGELYIAESTVETHRRNMISKLGVKGTLGLVRWAVENGIV